MFIFPHAGAIHHWWWNHTFPHTHTQNELSWTNRSVTWPTIQPRNLFIYWGYVMYNITTTLQKTNSSLAVNRELLKPLLSRGNKTFIALHWIMAVSILWWYSVTILKHNWVVSNTPRDINKTRHREICCNGKGKTQNLRNGCIGTKFVELYTP